MKIKRGAAVLAVLMLSVMMLCAFSPDIDNNDKVAIFKDIEIPEGTTVDGDAFAIFGDMTINGDLTGNAVVIFGNMSVSGTVEKNVISIFGEISVENNGAITGDVTGIMGRVDKSPNAAIKGEVTDLSTPLSVRKHYSIVPGVLYGDMIALLIVYVFSCLALLIAPGRIKLMSEESMTRPGRHLGIGFLTILLSIPVIFVLSVLFAITLVGIIFIPFIFIAFILVAFIGMTAVEVAIGCRIAGRLEGANSVYIHLLIGALLVYVLKVVPIFGWLAYLILVAYAMGVAVDTRLGSPKAGRQNTSV